MTARKYLPWIASALLLMAAAGANAAPIPLNLNPAAPQTLGPQSASAPCIIAGTNCQNPANFPFTDYVQGGGPSSDNDELSPIYAIEDFPFLTFDVAIDVNTNSSASETLELFSVLVDADGAEGAGGFEEIYAFLDGSTSIGGTANAGNGFGDWLLGTIDLSSYASNALVQFRAAWNGDVAGAESFFLVAAGPTPVTEPATLALIGFGLLAIAWTRRARKR
jgi:hypothetical protein